VLTLAFGALSLPHTTTIVHAQGPSWAGTLQTWLVDMVNFRGYGKLGFRLNPTTTVIGRFPSGLVPSQRAQVGLITGYRYLFLATCDQFCFDLSLELYDPTNRKVSEARISDGAAVLEYTPEYPGTFTVVATAMRCSVQAGLQCNWGYGILEARNP
jgi:hypothetical protein